MKDVVCMCLKLHKVLCFWDSQKSCGALVISGAKQSHFKLQCVMSEGYREVVEQKNSVMLQPDR